MSFEDELLANTATKEQLKQRAREAEVEKKRKQEEEQQRYYDSIREKAVNAVSNFKEICKNYAAAGQRKCRSYAGVSPVDKNWSGIYYYSAKDVYFNTDLRIDKRLTTEELAILLQFIQEELHYAGFKNAKAEYDNYYGYVREKGFFGETNKKTPIAKIIALSAKW